MSSRFMSDMLRRTTNKAYRTLTHQHRAGTFVCEDFGEEGIAIAAADDVGAVNSPA